MARHQHACSELCIGRKVEQLEDDPGPEMLVISHGERGTMPGVIDFIGISLVEEGKEGENAQHVVLTLRDWRRAVMHVGGILASVDAVQAARGSSPPGTEVH